MNNKVKFIRNNFGSWNRKKELNIGNNRLYKVVGCGKTAFKILKFGPNEETELPTWSQTWWKYNNLSKIGQEVVDKLYKEMGGK